MTEGSDSRASHVYDIVEQRMSRPKRWVLMGFFWVIALISFGHATPVPSTKAWAIVRKSDGKVVSSVDDEMAGEISVWSRLDADLQSLSQTEFEDAWGLEKH